MKSKKTREIFIVGFSMFAIFFGSGNLIFPPQIGLLSGQGVFIAMIGLGLSGILLPMLAVAAVGNTGYGIDDLTCRITPWWADLYKGLGVLVVAFGTIPRCGGVAFESGLQGITGELPTAGKVVFIVVFFLVSYIFASNRSGMVDKIGQFLTPFLLICLLVIIVLAVVNPIDALAEGSIRNHFTNAFLTGYNTGDVGTGIVCAGLFIAVFKEKGYIESKSEYRKAMFGIIAIGFVLLFIVYSGLAYMGAQGTALYKTDVASTYLLNNLVSKIAGNAGLIILSLAIIFACLTTAAGMIGTVSGWITDWSKGTFNYKIVAAILSIIIALVAMGGVAKVITISGPLFTLLFPMSVVMTFLGLFRKIVPNDGAWKGAVFAAFFMSIFDAVNVYVNSGVLSINMSGINGIINKIPLAQQGFSWLFPSVAGFIIGAIIFKARGKESKPFPV